MASPVESLVLLSERAKAVLFARTLSLPPGVQRRLAGKPVVIDGNELSVQAQLMLRLQRIARDGRRTTVAKPGAEFLAAGDGALWSLTNQGVLQRRDPRTGLPDGAALDLGAGTSSLAVAPGVVWVGMHDGGVTRIDPARNAVVWTRRVPIT